MLLVHGSLLAKYDLTAQLHEGIWFCMNFGLPNSCLDFFSHKLSCRPDVSNVRRINKNEHIVCTCGKSDCHAEWLEIYCPFVWDSKRTRPSKLSMAAGYSSCVTVLLQIKPLVQPTKDIMREPIRTFQWHEFFPHGICHEIPILHFLITFLASYLGLICRN